jgi:hypothetical protein
MRLIPFVRRLIDLIETAGPIEMIADNTFSRAVVIFSPKFSNKVLASTFSSTFIILHKIL